LAHWGALARKQTSKPKYSYGFYLFIYLFIYCSYVRWYWWGNLRERDHWGDPGVDGRIILRWIFRKWGVGVWTTLSWIRIQKVAGTCECGNEPLGSINCGEFVD
jgi:hypothetical protein